MTMASKVRNHLDRSGLHYDVRHHPHTSNSMLTAEAAHVSGEQLAKGVLLTDNQGYVLAVIPATHYVRVHQVDHALGRYLHMAREDELEDIFPDCESGAVPVLGPAYDIETVVDTALCKQPDSYFEAGDHEEWIHLAGEDFEELMEDARFMSCSMHRM